MPTPKYTSSPAEIAAAGPSSSPRGTRRPPSSGTRRGTSRPQRCTRDSGSTVPASTNPVSNTASDTVPDAPSGPGSPNPSPYWARIRTQHAPTAPYAAPRAQPGVRVRAAGSYGPPVRPQRGQSPRSRRRWSSAAKASRTAVAAHPARLRKPAADRGRCRPGSSPPTTSSSRNGQPTSSAAATAAAAAHHPGR
ncbi:hypothetical protein [Kitasatospora phosalacinea]|uniref:hypothetical protein n=1 Tax=Kitasatospora phosalacinea TaxID=2065 RepID=UPI0005254FEB|nr:hypothetical protein [Kitasatospora phosalacinea]